jgi:predicted ATPase
VRTDRSTLQKGRPCAAGRPPPGAGNCQERGCRLRLGFGADDFSYGIDFGLPAPSLTAFALDPEIKRESIWHGPVLRPAALLCDRHNGMVRLRGDDGTWGPPQLIRGYDSMLSEFADPQRARGTEHARADPVLAVLRLFPHRRRGTSPPQPGRHPHPGAGQ